MIQTPKQQFDVKADVHYERQNFHASNRKHRLGRLKLYRAVYRRNLPAKIIFTESGTFIPSWNDFSAYSAIFGAGLQLPTYKRFSLNINVLDNYLNNPAIGFKNNSLQFVTGVLYTLK